MSQLKVFRPRPRLARACSAVALIAIMLTLSRPPQAALAQNVGEVKISYHNEASLLPAKICVGDTVPILIRFIRQVSYQRIGETEVNISQRQSGVWVNGTVQNAAIGKLLAARQMVGFDFNTRSEVEFDFVALAAGTTKVSFAGESPDGADPSPVTFDVTVELCKLQVTTTSPWLVPGEAPLVLVAKIFKGELEAKSTNHFEGLADVDWFIKAAGFGDCTGLAMAGTSTAILLGDLDASGQLTVKVTFLPADVSISIVCTNGETITGADTIPVTSDPVSITLPSTGGNGVVEHNLIEPAQVPGKAVIVVLPVKP
jgi:hypothetical protein